MKIGLNSIIVKDQERALRFYTKTLGFTKKTDVPAGAYRWLTLISPEDPDGPQLVLEPNAHPASKKYQKELHKSGVPLTSFSVEDIMTEFDRLQDLGVQFKTPPTDVGSALVAVFDDTCGNLIQIYQEK